MVVEAMNGLGIDGILDCLLTARLSSVKAGWTDLSIIIQKCI